jgi:hypothetical protein
LGGGRTPSLSTLAWLKNKTLNSRKTPMKLLGLHKFGTRLALIPLLLLPLSACQTTGSVGTSSAAACQAFKPISWSKSDTHQTQEEIVQNNAVGKELCGSTGVWKGH